MAIKRKNEVSELNLPKKLEEMLLEGFTYQAIADQYEQVFKAVKIEVGNYLEHNTDDFNVDMGKGFKCSQGTVIYSERTTYDFDKEAILEMVQSGQISLISLISACSFSADKLKTVLGESNFKDVSTPKKTESLTLRASEDFKNSCKTHFYETLPEFGTAFKEIEEIKIKVPKEAKSEKISKAKEIATKAKDEALGKAKKKTKTVDEDISSLLKKIDKNLDSVVSKVRG